MEGLESKNLFKIMWLPEELLIVWNMSDESQVSLDSYIYQALNNYIDLKQWSIDYSRLYKKWLSEGLNDIYDLSHDVNLRILKAIGKVNDELKPDSIVFYWYDKDRTYDSENSSWTKSPISGDTLVDLDNNYHYLNRLVSLKDYLVFPKYPNPS